MHVGYFQVKLTRMRININQVNNEETPKRNNMKKGVIFCLARLHGQKEHSTALSPMCK